MKAALAIVLAGVLAFVAGIWLGFGAGYLSGGEDLCSSMHGDWMQKPRTKQFVCTIPDRAP